jgi:hypothetical protein
VFSALDIHFMSPEISGHPPEFSGEYIFAENFVLPEISGHPDEISGSAFSSPNGHFLEELYKYPLTPLGLGLSFISLLHSSKRPKIPLPLHFFEFLLHTLEREEIECSK